MGTEPPRAGLGVQLSSAPLLTPPLVEALEVQSEPLEHGDLVLRPLSSRGRMRRSAVIGAHPCRFWGGRVRPSRGSRAASSRDMLSPHGVTASSAPKASPLATCPGHAHAFTHARAHDIKVIFLVAGKAHLSLPLPSATRWPSFPLTPCLIVESHPFVFI